MNDWFDVMNSYVPENVKNPKKSAFGKSINTQIAILDQFFLIMSEMRHFIVKTGNIKRVPGIFQRCAMLSIVSLFIQ